VRIAIVGSGISGLIAAHRLHARHEITVYEAEPRIGGHTHTVDVELDGERHAVDTGFIVYNEHTYPHFTRLLGELGVASQPTDMSFAVRCERSGLEWGSRGLRGVFAQPGNALRPSFVRMLRDVARFDREAPALLERPEEKATLGDYLSGAGYSREFVEHYAIPMGAAIWSSDPESFLRMPAAVFVRFFANHGLLSLRPSLEWRVVRGGSARYAERLVAPFRDRIRTGCAVRALHRSASCVRIEAADGAREFDHVVLAVHSDQALRLLCDASELERRVLASIRYQRNEVILHSDASLLPRRHAARASWNYWIPERAKSRAVVTYDMNRLQGIASRRPLLVSLNAAGEVAPELVLRRFEVAHPVFDAAAIAAQRLHSAISGTARTHFCGAYWGYGFHEDGVRSAIDACARLEAA
jgi:predicted NAD/FAD-binding protein